MPSETRVFWQYHGRVRFPIRGLKSQLDRESKTMFSLRKHIRNFLNDESGPTAVEYAIIIALIMMTCVIAVKTLGERSKQMWENNNAEIQSYST